jgi:uncharacterized membrane-anchored protein
MNTKTKDGTRARNGMPSVSMGIVPEFSAIFWTNWLLAAMAGEIGGHALNHIYLRRSGRVIVALMLCFLAMSILQGATRRLPRMIFWSAAFLLSLLGAVLAQATDISMGVGDIGAILLIAILLIFSFVICYRLTGNLPGPMDSSNVRGFFWATAMLAQTVASACADWIIDPGGPSERLAIAVIALGIAATIGVYSCTRMPRSVLFWAVGDRGRARRTRRSEINRMQCTKCGASCRLSENRFVSFGRVSNLVKLSSNAMSRQEPTHRPQANLPWPICRRTRRWSKMPLGLPAHAAARPSKTVF